MLIANMPLELIVPAVVDGHKLQLQNTQLLFLYERGRGQTRGTPKFILCNDELSSQLGPWTIEDVTPVSDPDAPTRILRLAFNGSGVKADLNDPLYLAFLNQETWQMDVTMGTVRPDWRLKPALDIVVTLYLKLRTVRA